jgi:hypothetical protein
MIDYSDVTEVNGLLEKCRTADRDNRERARESAIFLHKDDGQWEPDIVEKYQGKPRYTFNIVQDECDDITGELAEADFAIKVSPAGGGADEDIADTYNGLIRSIENASDAEDVYKDGGVDMVESGFTAWRIKQEYGDDDSFDQSLFIRAIKNPLDNCWLDDQSRHKTAKDARHGFILEAMAEETAKKRFKVDSITGIGNESYHQVYYDKADSVVVGECVYEAHETRLIYEMTNGAVYVDDERFQQVKDDLLAAGIDINRERERKIRVFKSRLFDANQWLTKPQDTVFYGRLPIIPCYGNFRVQEDKIVWRGYTANKMDAGRVFNMTKSRMVEEAVLTSRRKPWLPKQALSDEESRKDAATLNTNTKPVQTYDWDAGMPPPMELGGAQVSPALAEISQAMEYSIRGNAKRMPGQPVGLASGRALQMEQEAEDVKHQKWFNSLKASIKATGEVLVRSIPAVYDARRQVRILAEDGTSEMVTLHETVRDEKTGQQVELNDISKGVYDVIATVGPQFRNRQQQTVDGILRMGEADPSIIQQGGDILLKNTGAPGMDIIAKRRRAMMLQQGLIPQDEMTEEELAQMQQAQMLAAQNQQPSPEMVIAQAEDKKANADLISEQNTQTELAIKAQAEDTKRFEAETRRMEVDKRVEAQRNRDNAAAAKGFADAHKAMGESGLADQDAATGGVDAYNEVITDHLQAGYMKGPRLIYDANSGDFRNA